MEIEAKVWKSDKPWLKANANITIDNSFVVKGIKVIEGKNGLFISMPNKKSVEGNYLDICFPITKEARKQINEAILEQYNKEEFVPNDEEQNPFEITSDSDLPF